VRVRLLHQGCCHRRVPTVTSRLQLGALESLLGSGEGHEWLTRECDGEYNMLKESVPDV
jgi:hypothetical protein